jgi:hypothetical protein
MTPDKRKYLVLFVTVTVIVLYILVTTKPLENYNSPSGVTITYTGPHTISIVNGRIRYHTIIIKVDPSETITNGIIVYGFKTNSTISKTYIIISSNTTSVITTTFVGDDQDFYVSYVGDRLTYKGLSFYSPANPPFTFTSFDSMQYYTIIIVSNYGAVVSWDSYSIVR